MLFISLFSCEVGKVGKLLSFSLSARSPVYVQTLESLQVCIHVNDRFNS